MRIIPPPIPPNRTEDYWPVEKDRLGFIKLQKKIKKAIKRALSYDRK